MKGDSKGKGKRTLADAAAPGRARKPATEAAPIDDVMLREYLLDALAPEVSARVEKALRDSAELRARLEDVRQNRADGQLHTLPLRSGTPHAIDMSQPPATRQLPS